MYFTFLVLWRSQDFSSLQDSAPTEQVSNLRKASHPVNEHSDDALDVRLIKQRRNEERARQIFTDVELPTTIPLSVPTPNTAFGAMTEKPRTLKIAISQQPNEHDPVAFTQTVKATPTVQIAQATAVVDSAAAPVTLDTVSLIEEPVANPIAPNSGFLNEQPVVAPKPVVPPVSPSLAAVVEEPAVIQLSPIVKIAPIPLATRNQTISGYAETIQFLDNYQYTPDESLFLFFVCSDEHFQPSDWSEECVKGKENVYDVFSKSPGRNRLVTVFAGSEMYWKYRNDFYDDHNLKVKGVPCIMQWLDSSGRTSGMLVQMSLYDVEFLEYLFRRTNEPKLYFPDETVKNKQIVIVNGYDAYVDAMTKFEEEVDPVSTFLMMIAGRFQDNKRPWCPYCRYMELPLQYAFYAFAPKHARLICVEVTDSYTDWHEQVDFTEDPNLQLYNVPLMFKIEQQPAAIPNSSNTIKFSKHKFRYDRLTPLREFFLSYV